MPRYDVYMTVTRRLNKPIEVWGSDEAEAEEKATEIVNRWEGVADCEPTRVILKDFAK